MYRNDTEYYKDHDDDDVEFVPSNFQGTTTAEQEAYAREEVGDVMIQNDHLMDEYYYEQQQMQSQGADDIVLDDFDADALHERLGSRSFQVGGGFDSRSSFHSVDDAHDPAYLFALLEEALPKTAAETTLQQQAVAREQLEQVWDVVRRWLWSHSSMEERAEAAHVRGQADATSLHLMCKLTHPPQDVIQTMVECAPETVSWVDAHGWLPLHHACANGASPDVMRILIEAYPQGKLRQDNQARTPLHFYATRNVDHVSALVLNTEMLADTGAAQLADKGGMLPMHYACAYGTKPEVLKVLAEAYPESLVATEQHGRTPMHLAMVNAHREASPNTIGFLLAHAEAKETINARDRDRYTPLHLLALGLKGYRASSDNDKRVNVSESLSLYLAAEPKASPDFLTAIQDLPDWLQDTAVVSKHVRNVLNKKIAQRFPTSILILDGYVLITLIVCFALTTKNNIDMRFDPVNTDDTSQVALIILLVAVVYFFWREVIQIASLISLGSFNNWIKDLTNWIDICVIILVMYYAALMAQGSAAAIDNNAFRSGAAFTQGLLWVSIIMFLKKTLVQFAVFVGGLSFVLRQLAAFLLAVGVILLAFAQMFYFVYVNTPLCDQSTDSICDFPHCTFQSSLLKVYVMMMGEVNTETRYSDNLTAQILYVAYGFLVVVLLSNVLIAIVTDSYEIIQNDRAAIVFWSNRLDFCAEMDAITYALKKRLACCFTSSSEKKRRDNAKNAMEGPESSEFHSIHDPVQNTDMDIFREYWKQVMYLFDSNLYDEVDWLETVIYSIFRIVCLIIVIPIWLAIGAITAGWLWPPQVREYLLVQKETVTSRAEQERQKLLQLKGIQIDLNSFKDEIMKELAADRDDMVRTRNEIEVVQSEVLADLLQVKELMGSLLGE
ncbi:hypothetical protein MPSEU_000316600 [Mayamaea pseudoterrestris]|nr:hypothetical protein MPSEU_000316600 [Mayamaea pseudoterrestris]